MHRRRWLWLAAVLVAALFALAACGGDDDDEGEAAGGTAGETSGAGADCDGPDIVPEQVVAGGQAEFGINWLDSLLATRDQGENLVNIAQVFTRSGMTEVTWKDSGLDQITDLRGKKVGVWLGGNEHKLFAALNKNGIDPQQDTEIIKQPFDMNLFLNREIDAAAAMTYNELAQVLETKNPDTGQLYQLADLNVMKMSDLGTGALDDGFFVREDSITE